MENQRAAKATLPSVYLGATLESAFASRALEVTSRTTVFVPRERTKPYFWRQYRCQVRVDDQRTAKVCVREINRFKVRFSEPGATHVAFCKRRVLKCRSLKLRRN